MQSDTRNKVVGTTAYYAVIIISLITAEKQDAHGLDRHPALVSY